MNKKLALDCLESFIRIQTMCETVAGCQDLIDRLKSEILGEEIATITDEKQVDKFKVGDKVYCYHYNKYGIVVKVGGSDWGSISVVVDLCNGRRICYTRDGALAVGNTIVLEKI